jgi:alkylhydroperoxidase/carboxymuconolactone decarboxylase family protein YurZ
MSEMPEELVEIVKYYPRFWEEAGHLFTETLYDESGLDRKTIELILCSLLSAWRWETGVKVHVGQALAAGATPAEIRGALLISGSVAGQSAPVRSLHWAESVLVSDEDQNVDR